MSIGFSRFLLPKETFHLPEGFFWLQKRLCGKPESCPVRQTLALRKKMCYNKIKHTAPQPCRKAQKEKLHMDDKQLFGADILPASEVTPEEELAAARELVKDSICRNTRDGYIDAWGCDAICADMQHILDQAAQRISQGEFVAAFRLGQYVIGASAALASRVDSSSGALACTVQYGFGLVQESAFDMNGGVSQEERQRVFNEILETARSESFNGWEVWRYSLLRCAISLANAENASQLYVLLDSLVQQNGDPALAVCDCACRFWLKRRLEGDESARAYLGEHLEMDSLRQLAIQMDMESGDFACAERLCLERVNDCSCGLDEWRELLCQIYRESGQEDKLSTI